MNEWNVPLFKIHFDENDFGFVSETIKRGSNWAVGSNIEQFESEICQYIGSNYAVSFNSGTSALHASLIAHGIKRNDEIIVPSFTFIATANSPLFVGAKPIFADIEEKTYGLDPESVLENITEKTKAIIPVHYAGCPCDIVSLREIADDYNLILVEDAAEAFGAEAKGKKVGTFGDSSMFSFCQNKIITTGEGGAIVTDSKEVFHKLKLIRSHGRLESHDYFSSTSTFDYITLGYNFRMSNITAALGRSQLQKVDKIIKMRRKNALYLSSSLEGLPFLRLPIPSVDVSHVYQLYTIFVDSKRDELMHFLENSGIFSKIYFSPVHLTHFYSEILNYDVSLPVTEDVSKHVLTLPMYPDITQNEMNYVASKIKEFYEVGL